MKIILKRKRDHRNNNEKKQCNMTLGDSVGIYKQYPGKRLFLVGDNFPATKELGRRTTVSFLFAGL